MAEVIVMDSEAFWRLIKEVVDEVKRQHPTALEKWLNPKQAMELLNITSPTTLQKLRDEGHIGYSQPMPKVILYDRDSIEAYLQKHYKKPFS